MARVPLGLGILWSVATVFFIAQDIELENGAVIRFFESSHVKWFAAAVIVGIWAALLIIGAIKRNQNAFLSPLDYLATGLLAYMALSVFWAPDRLAAELSLVYGAVSYSFFLLGRVTALRDALSILNSFAVAGIFLVLVVALWGSGQGTGLGFGNENFAAEYLVLTTMLAVYFWSSGSRSGRWLTWAAIATGFSFLVLVLPSTLQYLGILAAAIFAVGISGRRRLFGALLALGVFGILVIGTSVVFYDAASFFPTSWSDRAQTWGNVVVLIGDGPFLGRGIASLFHDMGGYADSYRHIWEFLGDPAYENFARQTDSTENEFLQILAEFGVPGAIIGVTFVGWLLTSCLLGGRTTSWLGLPLVAILAISLVSFPLQNAATIAPAAAIAGVVISSQSNREVVRKHAWWTRVPALMTLLVSIVAGLVSWPVMRASHEMEIGSFLSRRGDLVDAADRYLSGLALSDALPRLRLQAYTQTMVAGPTFWRERNLGPEQLDTLYRQAASASPGNALLLDLRIKQILSTPGLTLDIDGLWVLIEKLKAVSGHRNANGYVLEAALAMQLGELARVDTALQAARARLRDPPNRNDETNLQNIRSLEHALERGEN